MITKQEAKQKLSAYNEYMFTGAYANDLADILERSENIVKICRANGDTRYIRAYLVITDRRIIYVKNGKRDLSWVPFLKKRIIIDRQGLQFNVGKAEGLASLKYPYVLNLNSNGMCYTFSIRDDITEDLAAGGQQSVVKTEPVPPREDVGSTVQKRFCAYCGNPIAPGWVCCPACGKKLHDVESEMLVQQDTQTQLINRMPVQQDDEPTASNDTAGEPSVGGKQDEERSVDIYGYTGGLLRRPSEITTRVKVSKCNITINGNARGRRFVGYESFNHGDIMHFEVKPRFLWNIWILLVLVIVSTIAAVIINEIGIFRNISLYAEPLGLMLGVGVGIMCIAVGVSVFVSKGVTLQIGLRNGTRIRIPANQETDAILLLKAINYPYYRMEELKNTIPEDSRTWHGKKRGVVWIGVVLGIVLNCIVMRGMILSAEKHMIMDLSDDQDSNVTIRNIVETWWGDEGTWSTDVHYKGTSPHIDVEYTADKNRIVFSIQDDMLRIDRIEMDGSAVTDSEKCDAMFDTFVDYYFETTN